MLGRLCANPALNNAHCHIVLAQGCVFAVRTLAPIRSNRCTWSCDPWRRCPP